MQLKTGKMKKVIFVMAFMVATVATAQKKWSLDVGMGGHFVDDQRNSELDDNFNHYNATLRYMGNNKVGLGLNGAHDNLSFVNGTDVEYERLNLKVYVDLMDMVDLENRNFALLANIGPGVSSTRQKRQVGTEREFSANVSGGASAIFALGNSLGLKFDWTSTANFNESSSLDRSKAACEGNITSLVHNFSAGLVFYIGKEKGRHRDFIVPVPQKDTMFLKPTIIDKTVTVNNTRVVAVADKGKFVPEYLFFTNDGYTVSKESLNAIMKSFDALDNGNKIYLKGLCSPPATSEYNKALAKRRVDAVISKLHSLGVKDEQIVTDYYGEQDTVDGNNVDLKRHVKLEVK